MSALTLLAQAAPAEAQASSAELWVFLVVGAIALGSAVSVVLLRNAVHAALMLVVNFFMIAVLYALLEAQFLATIQIVVYAGAIMVLFLFVIMLLGVDRQDDPTVSDRLPAQRTLAILFGLVLFGALAFTVAGPYLAPESACPSPAGAEAPCVGLAQANEQGNTEGVGALLFGRYVWPFEVISVLLVIAAIGAIVLGRKTERPEDLVDALDRDVDPGPGDVDGETDDGQPPVPEPAGDLESSTGAVRHEEGR